MIEKIIRGGRFPGLIIYATDPAKGVEPDDIRLYGVSSVEHAAQEMQFAARQSKRCKRAVYHVILAWAKNENPTPAEQFEAGEELLRRLGLSGHQRVAVRHAEHPHHEVHLVVNLVGPSGRAWDTKNDYARAQRAVAEIADERGWKRVNGHFNQNHLPPSERIPVEHRQRQGAHAREAATGIPPLAKEIRCNDHLMAALHAARAAKSWSAFHQALLDAGYEAVEGPTKTGSRSRGLVVHRRVSLRDMPDRTKASAIASEFGYGAMIGVCGPYLPMGQKETGHGDEQPHDNRPEDRSSGLGRGRHIESVEPAAAIRPGIARADRAHANGPDGTVRAGKSNPIGNDGAARSARSRATDGDAWRRYQSLRTSIADAWSIRRAVERRARSEQADRHRRERNVLVVDVRDRQRRLRAATRGHPVIRFIAGLLLRRSIDRRWADLRRDQAAEREQLRQVHAAARSGLQKLPRWISWRRADAASRAVSTTATMQKQPRTKTATPLQPASKSVVETPISPSVAPTTQTSFEAQTPTQAISAQGGGLSDFGPPKQTRVPIAKPAETMVVPGVVPVDRTRILVATQTPNTQFQTPAQARLEPGALPILRPPAEDFDGMVPPAVPAMSLVGLRAMNVGVDPELDRRINLHQRGQPQYRVVSRGRTADLTGTWALARASDGAGLLVELTQDGEVSAATRVSADLAERLQHGLAWWAGKGTGNPAAIGAKPKTLSLSRPDPDQR